MSRGVLAGANLRLTTGRCSDSKLRESASQVWEQIWEQYAAKRPSSVRPGATA